MGFAVTKVGAVAAVKDSGVEVRFKDYGQKLGVAPCQVCHVPAHYTTCLPAGKPYWAIFVSRAGKSWTEPQVGLSSITLHPGDSVGLRYGPPKGKPAAPLVPPPASVQ